MKKKNKDYINAIVVYNYLGDYIKFEELIKKEFISNFEKLRQEYKNRVYFYLGGIGSLNTYIDYDTYSLIKETHKYDNSKLLYRLTMNHIIKLERKEQTILKFNQSIDSIQTSKLQYTFCDCCIKLINTRNKIAHEFFKLNLKENKDIIEILSKDKIEKFKPEWLGDFEYDELEYNTIAILSNYIYMKQMEKIMTDV